eukprot:s2283_g7.t1
MGQAMQQMMNQGNPMMNTAAPMAPTVPQQMVPHNDGQSEQSESDEEQEDRVSGSGSAGSRESRAVAEVEPAPAEPALPALPAVHDGDEEQWRAQRFADSFISRSVSPASAMPAAVVTPKTTSPVIAFAAPPPEGHRAKAAPLVVPVTAAVGAKALGAPPVPVLRRSAPLVPVVGNSAPPVPVPEAPKAPMSGPARDSDETVVLPPAGSEPEAPQAEPRQADRADFPICSICQDDMLPSQELLSLWCTHTYHKYCIEEWRHLCNKSEIECPCRCHLQNINVDGFEIVDPDPEAAGSTEEEAASGSGSMETPVAPPVPSESEIGEAAAEVADSVV